MIDEDHCIYVKCHNNLYVILSFYIDDILMTSNNKNFLLTVKKGYPYILI